MCNQQTLFHDDRIGYVVRCNECAKLQIGFGNLMLTFHEEDFESFRKWILKIKAEQQPQQNKACRCIIIPTPCEGMKLLLSKNELNDFSYMLETADTELQSLALLKLFV
jgi:hypothetical protein